MQIITLRKTDLYIYSKGKLQIKRVGGKGKTQILLEISLLPKCYNRPSWARPQPGCRNFILVFYVGSAAAFLVDHYN